MKLVFRNVVILMMGLTVASCGGGGSGGVASMPTPTPTPSQPAAVTAPVSYLASSPSGGNLDALPVHYKTADANNRITGTVITTAAEVRITDIRYDGSSYTITARDQAGSQNVTNFQYASGNRTASTPTNFDTFQRSLTYGDLGTVDSGLTIFRSTDSSSHLGYVSYGMWEVKQNTGASRTGYQTWFLFGSRTPDAARLNAGTVTYNGIADGTAYIGGTARRLSGTGQVTRNFANDMTTTNIDLRVNNGSGGTNTFGTLQQSNTFGSDATTTNGFSGRILFVPYGPNAEEIGGIFSLSNQVNDTAVGVFVGKR
ncbi:MULTISPECIES: transferrin-binding protein-like solute binding protein [Sphingobium]|nr:transferrin-binding protein-like solute binding protein [Sphingobium indicum]